MFYSTALLLRSPQPFTTRNEFEVVARHLVNSPILLEHNWNEQRGHVKDAWVVEDGLVIELALWYVNSIPVEMPFLAIGQHPVRGELEVSFCRDHVLRGGLITMGRVSHH